MEGKNLRKGLSQSGQGKVIGIDDHLQKVRNFLKIVMSGGAVKKIQPTKNDDIELIDLPNKFNQVDTKDGQPFVYVPSEAKIDVEIRDIIRIKPSDFSLLKDSFEEWASRWN